MADPVAGSVTYRVAGFLCRSFRASRSYGLAWRSVRALGTVTRRAYEGSETARMAGALSAAISRGMKALRASGAAEPLRRLAAAYRASLLRRLLHTEL